MIKLILDTPLNLIPFSALTDSRFKYSQALIKSTNIQRVSSINSIKKTIKQLNSKNRALVIFDPVNSSSDSRHLTPPEKLIDSLSYPRLKNTILEAKTIKSKFNTTLLSGFDANKNFFLQNNFDEYDFIHIATHAFFHSEIPGLSALVLSNYSSDGNQLESAYVRSIEINQLNLEMDLTVLSGCETGVGANDDALGLDGLTDSFINSGSQNIIASLWKVEDQISMKLMDVFYSELSSGTPINKSLRIAQKKIMSNPRTKHPKLWAGWFLLSR